MAQNDPSELVHFGRKLSYGGLVGEENTYVGGAAGMLLTKAAVARLGAAASKDSSTFLEVDNTPSDFLMSRSLIKLGIKIGDTVDEKGAQRFLVLGVQAERTVSRTKQKDLWLWAYSKDAIEGPKCCSTKWISSYDVTEDQVAQLCVRMLTLRCIPSLALCKRRVRPIPMYFRLIN